jgi:hypothetical protein
MSMFAIATTTEVLFKMTSNIVLCFENTIRSVGECRIRSQ